MTKIEQYFGEEIARLAATQPHIYAIINEWEQGDAMTTHGAIVKMVTTMAKLAEDSRRELIQRKRTCTCNPI